MDYKSAFIIMCANDKDAYKKLIEYSDPTANYIEGSDLPLRLFCYEEGILRTFFKKKHSSFSLKSSFGGGEYIYDDIKEKAHLYYAINNIIDSIIEHPKYEYDYEEKYYKFLEKNYPAEIHFTKVSIIISAKNALVDKYIIKKMVAKDAIDKVAFVFRNEDSCLVDLFLTVCNELFDDYKPTTISNPVTYERMEKFLQTCNTASLKSIPSYIDYWDRKK